LPQGVARPRPALLLDREDLAGPAEVVAGMHQRLDVQLVDGPLLDLVVVAAVRLVRFVGLAIAELAQLASKFLALFGRHRTGRLAPWTAPLIRRLRPVEEAWICCAVWTGPPIMPTAVKPLLTYVSCLAALRADRLFPVNRADRSDGAPAFRGDNASMTARILRRSIRTCSSVSMPRWFVTWRRV
jgi:hypothetical protein